MCQDSPSHTTGIWEVPPLNSPCSYLGPQWHHSWRVDAEIPCFMYLWTFPSQVAPTLYWGCQIIMRTNQDRSELGRSHYLSCLWKHKVRKTWTVSWFWWLIQTQIFESFFFPLCVRNLKTDNMFHPKIIQMNGYLKTASGKHSFKIWKPSITAESLYSIISHRIMDDFDFSFQLMTPKILISWEVLQHIKMISITR